MIRATTIGENDYSRSGRSLVVFEISALLLLSVVG